MKVLDLFCGAGLVADGLLAAGVETLIGVDLKRQPRYPAEAAFLQADVLALNDRFLDWFDVIWASPPCLKDTALHASARREQAAHGAELTDHADLISPTRDKLKAWAARTGGKWVIENVYTAPLIEPVVLNGFMFELGATVAGVRYHLERKRKFETNWPLVPPWFERQAPVIGVYGGHARLRSAKYGGRKTGDFPGVEDKTALMREAMGVDRYVTGEEASQGIPPAYSRYVMEQLLKHMEGECPRSAI